MQNPFYTLSCYFDHCTKGMIHMKIHKKWPHVFSSEELLNYYYLFGANINEFEILLMFFKRQYN